MEKRWIILPSITYAYKARDFLSRKGISVYIERTPEALRTKGCSYSLVLRGDVDRAVALLQSAGFPILGRAGGSADALAE